MKLKHDRKIQAHPGEILGELIVDMGITQTALAKNIGVTQSYISDIINGRRDMTASMAFKLAASVGLTPETWMTLQKNWELSKVDPDIAKGIKKMAA